MSKVLYILSGQILLLLASTCEWLLLLWYRLHAFFCRSYDCWRGRAERESYERNVLEQCKAKLSKRPLHLVIVIPPDDCNVDAVLLVQIFNYAMIVGIEHISVYDRRKQSNGYVDLALYCERKEGRCLTWQPPNQIKEQRSYAHNGKSNGYTNGTHLKQLKLYQINADDGHALIADVCRELYEQRATPSVQSLLGKREALTERIGTLLNDRIGFGVPDPEVGIIFAHQICTYGLLPWHVRFTEFYRLSSERYFDAKTFAHVLYKYARCEQRWGK